MKAMENTKESSRFRPCNWIHNTCGKDESYGKYKRILPIQAKKRPPSGSFPRLEEGRGERPGGIKGRAERSSGSFRSVFGGSVRSRGGAWGEARRSLEKRGEAGGCQVGSQCVSVGERSRDAERRSVANQRATWGPPPGKGAKWGPQPGRVCRSQGGPGCSFERRLAARAVTC